MNKYKFMVDNWFNDFEGYECNDCKEIIGNDTSQLYQHLTHKHKINLDVVFKELCIND